MAFYDTDWTGEDDGVASLEVTDLSWGYRVRMVQAPSLWSKFVFGLRRLIIGRVEIHVDRQARVVRRLRLSLFGRELDRRTARFEEISRLDLAIGSSLRDALAGRGHCDGGKLILRRDGKSSVFLRGDISELDAIAARIRRDTGAR